MKVACIKMAGPAADFAYMAERYGENVALEITVDGWLELLSVTTPDDDPDAMCSDQAGAAGSGLIAYGFAWAAGFFEANRALVTELAVLLLGSGGQLGYDRVASFARGRVRGADDAVMVRMFAKLAAFTEPIDRVQAHAERLQRDWG